MKKIYEKPMAEVISLEVEEELMTGVVQNHNDAAITSATYIADDVIDPFEYDPYA